MNQHLDEATFRATHELHGVLEVTDLSVKLPGASRYVVIRCPADDKSITKLIGAEELLMARQRKVDVDARDAQPPLVDLTEEEKAALPGNLATAVKEIEDLKAAHKKVAREHAAERKKVEAKISAYASQIRNGGR